MTAITSDIITALNNQLELCKVKNYLCPVSFKDFIEGLQAIYFDIDLLIKRCRYFVYEREIELNFAYYEVLKKKVFLLLEQMSFFKTELDSLGYDTDDELVDFFNDFDFDTGAFFDANKVSNNQKQSDDFNIFVDSTIASLDFQSSSETQSKSIKTKNNCPDEIEDIHPLHNPNLWDESCYEMFKYLYNNYYDGKTKRNLTNIWFFLKEKTSEKYMLHATKDTYKDFIKTTYNIFITNFDKGTNVDKFNKVEFLKLNKHCINFENNLTK